MKLRALYFTSVLALALSCLPATIAYADDTEIFFNEEVLKDTEKFQPNVLFIMDNSGSMNDRVIVADRPYDPDKDYRALTGHHNDTNVYVYGSSAQNYLKNIIPADKNRCKAMIDHLAANPTRPVYTNDRVAFWKTAQKKWVSINPLSRGQIRTIDTHVECRADRGVHGIVNTAINKYVRNGATTPWTSDKNLEINWGRISRYRKYVSANYHWYLQSTVMERTTKINVMKRAASELVDDFSGINLGLMRFNRSQGGHVMQGFSSIETRAEKDLVKARINSLTAWTWTPLTETLSEAHQYLSGGDVYWGNYDNGVRDTSVESNGKYLKPIGTEENQCSKNYIVYLTDGTPYHDEGRDPWINDQWQKIFNNDKKCAHQNGAPNGRDSTCMDELAAVMAHTDYNEFVDGVQGAQIYTVSFIGENEKNNGSDNKIKSIMKAVAEAGKGEAFSAEDANQLKTAFTEIIESILSDSTVFTAPSVTVNAYNSLQNRDEVYYTIFKPSKDPRWYGNIKKYKINSSGDILDVKENPNQPAVDKDTGYFNDKAKSFWSGGIDGSVVEKGGAAEQLTNYRKVFTIVGDPTATNIALNTDDNIISDDNPLLTNVLLGLDDAAETAEREALIGWIVGGDVNDLDADDNLFEASMFMADPLHSRPTSVTYDANTMSDNGQTSVELQDYLFATTNSGRFHAIDASNGHELFSFIPQELLANQLAYKQDDPEGVRHYGLDGPMTVWRQESADEDVKIEPADGDHVYAYFGMRRGGSSYYAMDLTNLQNPKLKWTIRGDGDNTTTGFEDMGQTWSKPVRSQISWCTALDDCEIKDVLVFGGGYDTVHDAATSPTTGDKGAAIYMVDAKTGKLLWSAGNNSDSLGSNSHTLNLPLSNSIPGDITIADMNNDGISDILFAIDIVGNIWRIDLNTNYGGESKFATGGKIAELGDYSSTDENFRRFYVGPSVSLSKKRGRSPFYLLAVGSGYVAHPKNTDIDDRMYVVFERSVYQAPTNDDGEATYTTIDSDDMLNLTDPTNGPADPQTNAYHGFYKQANTNGEKFLRPAITRRGYIVYSSYLPAGGNVATACGGGDIGTARLYAMNFVSGVSAYDEEYIDLKHPGIAPEAVALLIPDGERGTKTILCLGTECFAPEDEENPWDEVTTQILYWRENIR